MLLSPSCLGPDRAIVYKRLLTVAFVVVVVVVVIIFAIVVVVHCDTVRLVSLCLVLLLFAWHLSGFWASA